MFGDFSSYFSIVGTMIFDFFRGICLTKIHFRFYINILITYGHVMGSIARKKLDESQPPETDGPASASPAVDAANKARSCVGRTLRTFSYVAAFMDVPDPEQEKQFFLELERRFAENPKLYFGLSFPEVKAAFEAHPECIFFVLRMEGWMAEQHREVINYIRDFGTYFYCGCKDKSRDDGAGVSVLKAPKA
jgi:hypothetical protein